MTNKEKEQALRLSELYKELAEKGTKFEYNRSKEGWSKHLTGPSMDSNLEYWRVAEKQDKIIDMSCLVGSDILCEFFITHNQAVIDRLIEIREDKPNKFVTDDDVYDNCRVMQNYWHSWQGGDNPLPEGLEVEVLLKEGTVQSGYTTETYSWNWCNDMTDIIAFRVLGTTKGWKYENNN